PSPARTRSGLRPTGSPGRWRRRRSRSTRRRGGIAPECGHGGNTMRGAAMAVATIPASDLDRALAFYRDSLGLELLWESPASIRFRIGTSELSVFRRPGLE